MKEETKMKTRILVVFSVMTSIVWGQDVILQGETKREIDKVSRIPTVPVADEAISQQAVQPYPLLSIQQRTSIEVDSIPAANIKLKENLSQLYRTYVKVGFGTEAMPLGEVFFNSLRSRKYVFGLHAKHLSSWGNIKGYERSQFDRTDLKLFGGIIERKFDVNGAFRYRNQGLHYYAIKAPVDSLGRDVTRQRYNDFGFRFDFGNSAKIDTFKIKYNVGVDYNYFSTAKPRIDSLSSWRAQEHAIGIFGKGEYRLKENLYGARLEVEHNGFTYGPQRDTLQGVDTAYRSPNTIIRLAPNFQTFLWDNKFKATVGVDITLNVAEKLRAHIYPIAEVKYSLFNDIFIPYVGVRGGMKQRTLKSLALQNEFIRPNVALRNESIAWEFYGGFKGTLSKRIFFDVNTSYGTAKDFAMFVNDTLYSLGNRFDVIYDTAKIFKLQGSISYQMLEKLKVDVIGTYYSYELKNNVHAWNMPDFDLIARAHYNLFNKFYLNFDFKLEIGRKALVYETGEGSIQENLQSFRKLNPIYDFNLGLEYRYTKRLSVFVQMNNIAAQRYQRWYNAPVHSFQFLGGLTFRF